MKNITVKQLWDSHPVLVALFAQGRTTDFRVLYKAYNFWDGIQPLLNPEAPHERVRRQALEKYALKVEGQDAYTFNGLPQQNFEDFQDVVREIGAEVIEVPDVTFSLDELSKFELRTGLTAEEMRLIHWLISE